MDHYPYFQQNGQPQSQSQPQPSSPDNSAYPDPDSVTPALYPWMSQQQHPDPEAFPTATGPLVFEGFVPDGTGLSNDQDSSRSIYPPIPFPITSAPTHIPSNANRNFGYHPTPAFDEGDSPAQNVDSTAYNTPGDGVEETTPRRRGRPRGSSKKTGFRGRGGWSKGLKLGRRVALEPSEEFSRLHQQATNAFIDQHDNEQALILINKAIAINPEVFSAHALLSEVYFSMDDSKKAIDVLFLGAHAATKDPNIWQQVADACLQRSTYDRETSLNQALYAFNRLVQMDHEDHDSRFQRAAILKELDRHVKVLNELHIILNSMPHNSSVLKLYAETCIELGDVNKALGLFKEAIEHYQTVGFTDEDAFNWSDVSVYVDLVSRNIDPQTTVQQALAKAVKALKKLSRWLLGREIETFWDNVENSDCEWDAEDEPRRTTIKEYCPGAFDINSYSFDLPLELRVKLGLLRLKQDGFRDEALAHFEWLEPDDTSEEANVFNFSDLFFEVGLALNEAKEHDQALRFLEPLKGINAFSDSAFWLCIGASSDICGKKDQALECFEEALKDDDECIEAMTQLSKLHTERGEKEIALTYAREAVSIARDAIPKTDKRKYERKDQRLARKAAEAALREANRLRLPGERSRRARPILTPRPPVRTKLPKLNDGKKLIPARPGKSRRPTAKESEAERHERAQQFYTTLQANTQSMRSGDKVARGIWMDCAKSLIEEFRKSRVLFPPERYMRFAGFDGDKAAKRVNPMSTPSRATAAAGHYDPDSAIPSIENITTTYQDIDFSKWLDIFLEYAILVANTPSVPDAQQECYATITAAMDCTVWYHQPPSMLQIHICYLSCALAFRDEATLFNTVLRWFMRQFQYCTDAYRLFAAINLFFPHPNDKAGKAGQMSRAIFKGGPFQKFLFRQVMSIDHQLPANYNIDGDEGTVPEFMRKQRVELFRLQRDGTGSSDLVLRPAEMDVVLLTIYGHVLYAAGSFLNALSYFYRAYSLDPRNPVVLLSISLSYMHQMFKRQNENRHMYVLQGWAFFNEYAEARTEWAEAQRGGNDGDNINNNELLTEVKREIEFNKARCWHMLGMSDLAVREYGSMLEGNGLGKDHSADEEYSMEAAYALQTMYAMSGNMAMAREITEKHLVVE